MKVGKKEKCLTSKKEMEKFEIREENGETNE